MTREHPDGRGQKKEGVKSHPLSLLLSDYHLIIQSSLLLVRTLIVRAVLWTLWTGLRAVRVLRSLLGTGLGGAVHVLRGGVPSLREFLGVAVDVRDVLILDSLLEGAEG